MKNYKYTSLAELNAVLKLYNIEADKGKENSRVAKHNGLLYHTLDEKGNRVGVPIKASRFYDKPTMKSLEKKFAVNEIKRQSDKSRIKNVIDTVFLKNNIIILPQLIKQLQKEGIDTVLRQNEVGLIYGVTFVDHKTKSVFNGSSVGKEYSAKGLQGRCNANQDKKTAEDEKVAISRQELIEVLQEYKDKFQFNELPKFIDLLMKSENDYQCVPKEFKRRRKKKDLR
ncbi:hypothetical protein GN157_14870 [Flavobacterium rakeshii]|uniref:Uncharacterized protein n=1 Tax=Flavobacterium rakeshii TaxID=1038845 RepID=A0A6N8HGX0_9FLAO|nr:hypothetical protein [Flavobacterium rakeshii]MUV04997.1 hypothetical protein [Flavobacterium rakeshii]